MILVVGTPPRKIEITSFREWTLRVDRRMVSLISSFLRKYCKENFRYFLAVEVNTQCILNLLAEEQHPFHICDIKIGVDVRDTVSWQDIKKVDPLRELVLLLILSDLIFLIPMLPCFPQ